jgi:hypothetical protein
MIIIIFFLISSVSAQQREDLFLPSHSDGNATNH